MDEVFARRDMLSPQEFRAFTGKSDLAGFAQLTSHLGAIGLTGVALSLTWGSWVAVPVFLAHGVLLNFLYAGQHEMSHWTVFRTRSLNMVFGRLFGFILFYPRDFDQIQHYAHHRYTNIWGKDGELGRPKYTLTTYLLWLLGPTYWTSRIQRIVRLSRGIVIENYIPDNRKAGLVREARLHLAGYGAIAVVSLGTGSWLAITHWIAPMFLTKCVQQLQNTIEHLGLPHVEDITRNTRSTRTNPVLRWAAWNMQYHTAHHAFPGVPFHKLAKLHHAIFTSKGRKPAEMTYLGFQFEVIRALRHGKTEADYPDDRIWVGAPADLAPPAVQTA